EIVTCNMKPGSFLLLNQLTPHCSTENLSDGIRWSVDLRWQRPDLPSGFERIKPNILMRTARDPKYRPDWTEWANQSRTRPSRTTDKPVDEFNLDINGYWMDRWRK